MFVHTVYFWLHDSATATDRPFFEQQLQQLSTIEHIHAAYVGVPAPTRREVIDSSYDYSITFVFKTQAEHDLYQPHPAHKAFVEKCAHFWKKVQVYDAIPF
jgi:hypothetical protein